MASSQLFLEYVQEHCTGLEVRFRAMMGEYILYYRDRIAGGLYDNRLLVRDVPAARALLPDAVPEPPYPGARAMLPVNRLDDGEFLATLFRSVYPELPAARPRKVKK